jgi:hypothetical protein
VKRSLLASRGAALRAALIASPALFLAACGQTSWPEHEPIVIEDAGADSVKAWPPGARYGIPGDVAIAAVRGVRRVYECARLLEFNWTSVDSAGAIYVRPRARVELPPLPDCALSTGLDTAFEALVPATGKKLYFRTPAGVVTDSLLSIAATGVVEGFLHPPGDTLRVHNRFTFRDSTAGHPRRILYVDSLETCELIHGAAYTRLHGGDTLSIAFRTLLAAPLDTTLLPACAGPHADTAEVVENRYGYP